MYKTDPDVCKKCDGADCKVCYKGSAYYPLHPTKRQIYDELSVLLTDYEGNGSSVIPTADDLYEMLRKIQINWETVITAEGE